MDWAYQRDLVYANLSMKWTYHGWIDRKCMYYAYGLLRFAKRISDNWFEQWFWWQTFRAVTFWNGMDSVFAISLLHFAHILCTTDLWFDSHNRLPTLSDEKHASYRYSYVVCTIRPEYPNEIRKYCMEQLFYLYSLIRSAWELSVYHLVTIAKSLELIRDGVCVSEFNATCSQIPWFICANEKFAKEIRKHDCAFFRRADVRWQNMQHEVKAAKNSRNKPDFVGGNKLIITSRQWP